MQQVILFFTYLADAVDDNEYGPQDVTAGRVFAHDVLIPQLDWHKGAKQLTKLLYQQVELSLIRNKTKRETQQQIMK